jgi:hypothetical protein
MVRGPGHLRPRQRRGRSQRDRRRARGGGQAGGAHLDLRRVPRPIGRHRQRGRGRRLPEGDAVRALQTGGRAAGPGGGRARDRGRDREPVERLRPRALARHRDGPGHSRCHPAPPPGRPARRHDARVRGRRRERPRGGLRPRNAGRALHPGRRLLAHARGAGPRRRRGRARMGSPSAPDPAGHRCWEPASSTSCCGRRAPRTRRPGATWAWSSLRWRTGSPERCAGWPIPAGSRRAAGRGRAPRRARA